MSPLEIAIRIILVLAVLALFRRIAGDLSRRPFPWFRHRPPVPCDAGSLHCASCSPGQGCGMCSQVDTQLTAEPASPGPAVGENTYAYGQDNHLTIHEPWTDVNGNPIGGGRSLPPLPRLVELGLIHRVPDGCHLDSGSRMPWPVDQDPPSGLIMNSLNLRPFTKSDWYGFAGAEALSLNPDHGPYIGEYDQATILVSGSGTPDEVLVQSITEFHTFEFRVPAGIRVRTLQEAQALVSGLEIPTHTSRVGWTELN